jgi:hypothetical protein
VLSVGSLLPRRTNREDFDESRERAGTFQSRRADQQVREWIRATTEPGTVFLANYRQSLYVIAPAGGKVVALDPVFANPYVDLAAREQDQRSMEERIRENDRARYCETAARHQVKYVMWDIRDQGLRVPANTFLEEAATIDDVRIFRAPHCSAGGGERP